MKLYFANCTQNAENTKYPNCAEISGLEDLLNAVKRDHVAPRMKEFQRSTDNFLEANCIMLDLDNTHSEDPDHWKALDDISETFPDVRFYCVKSRNYMKEKTRTAKDGTIIHYEAREKFHLYFPLSQSFTDYKQYESLMLKVAGLFPYFDLSATKPAQFFFGVPNAEGSEISGDITLDEFMLTVTPKEIKSSVEDFAKMVKSGEYKSSGYEAKKAANRLSSYLGVPIQLDDDTNQDAIQDSPEGISYSEENFELAKIEQQNQLEWLKTWAQSHGVMLGKIYPINTRNHPNAVCICVSCPWEDKHTTNGGKAEAVIIIDLEGKLSFLCRHEHCAGKGWKDFRSYYEQKANASNNQNSNNQFAESNKDLDEPIFKQALASMQMFSAEQLASEKFDPIFYPVEGVIPTGLTVLGAPPKTGKSWLCLDLAIQVASGEPFLSFPTQKCGVIYFSLEDCDVFAQERLNIVLAGKRPPTNLHLILNGVETMDSGFFTQADALLKAYPDTRIMIVDTLALIAGAIRRGESSYAYDYRVGSSLKKYADARNIAIIAVTHTTKLKHSEDFLMNISGTNGVSGSADCTIVLDKEKRTDKNALFFICGRRVRQASHEIVFDDHQCKWLYQRYMAAESSEALKELEADRLYMTSDVREAVIEIAKHNSSWVGSAGELRKEASRYGIGVVEGNTQIGKFLCDELGRFMKHDRIHVWKIGNGTGANRYRISEWKPADSDLFKDLDGLTIDEIPKPSPVNM